MEEIRADETKFLKVSTRLFANGTIWQCFAFTWQFSIH